MLTNYLQRLKSSFRNGTVSYAIIALNHSNWAVFFFQSVTSLSTTAAAADVKLYQKNKVDFLPTAAEAAGVSVETVRKGSANCRLFFCNY